MLQKPIMKLSRIMSKYFWEAYCLFEILHDENLHLDIISNIDWIGYSTIFFKFECFVKRLFLLVLVHSRLVERVQSHLKNGEYFYQ
jgi:hypothetical protein